MSIRVLEIRRANQSEPVESVFQKPVAVVAPYATRLIIETLKQDGLQLTMVEPVKLLIHESLLYWLPLQSIKAFYLDRLAESGSPTVILVRTGLLFSYSKNPFTVKEIREGDRRPVLHNALALPIGSSHVLYALTAPESYLPGWIQARALPRYTQPTVLLENAAFGGVSIGVIKQENPLAPKKPFRVKSILPHSGARRRIQIANHED